MMYRRCRRGAYETLGVGWLAVTGLGALSRSQWDRPGAWHDIWTWGTLSRMPHPHIWRVIAVTCRHFPSVQLFVDRFTLTMYIAQYLISIFSGKSLKLLLSDLSYFKAKMHQIRFRLGLTALPQIPSCISGGLSLLLRGGMGWEGTGRGLVCLIVKRCRSRLCRRHYTHFFDWLIEGEVEVERRIRYCMCRQPWREIDAYDLSCPLGDWSGVVKYLALAVSKSSLLHALAAHAHGLTGEK